MPVLERNARALTGAEAWANVEVLRNALLDLDDDHLFTRWHVGIFEADVDARKDAQRG